MTDRTDHELDDELATIDGRLRTLEQLVDRYIAGTVPLEQLLDDCDATAGATEAELERDEPMHFVIDETHQLEPWQLEALRSVIMPGPDSGTAWTAPSSSVDVDHLAAEHQAATDELRRLRTELRRREQTVRDWRRRAEQLTAEHQAATDELRRLQQLIIDDVDDAHLCEQLCTYICAGPCGGPT